jgi:hypothetical protein
MADLLCLSYWLRGFAEVNMLRRMAAVIDKFPFSATAAGVTTLRVYAIEFAEPPLLETYYPSPADAATILSAASEFRAADCAYLASGYWDLWQWQDRWNLAPSPVQIHCHGPAFDDELGDHLRIELGLDATFLPVEGAPAAATRAKSNLQSVLHLAKDLDRVLPVDRRHIWTESGDDFAQRFQESLA